MVNWQAFQNPWKQTSRSDKVVCIGISMMIIAIALFFVYMVAQSTGSPSSQLCAPQLYIGCKTYGVAVVAAATLAWLTLTSGFVGFALFIAGACLGWHDRHKRS